ncbi:MAG: ASPIC/UnbV domain-containing protein, partial [Planctomycetes bacterium]|nr:ASPIC/UnbV domain-containing protein [Planctomycetota bacterium]
MSSCVVSFLLLAPLTAAVPSPAEPAGAVCNVKVVSDKVPDVSSIDAWKKSFLTEGMSDRDKALAAWRTVVLFQHQDSPPNEFLHSEIVVQDPIKLFNVYGYGFCSMASCGVEALARHAGLKARGWGINAHSVPEVYWDGAWHLLDASLINYFPKADGNLASVEEIMAAIKEWYDRHPGYKGKEEKLIALQRADGWTGWRKGPELLTHSPFLDAGGWWPARVHGWYSTMQEYDGTYGKDGKPFLYEYGYSQGYRVNVQLRPGERLVRNWSNKGLHVNGKSGGAPGCLTMKTGADALVYTPRFGDLAPGRVGNGTLEYDVPVTNGAWRGGALLAENLDGKAVRVRDASNPGVLVLRMPSSYVYLTGTLMLNASLGEGGSIAVSLSDNNGLDWKEAARVTSSGEKRLDLTPLVLRRYDYRLRFELRGKGTALDAVRIVHDVQHSQRALPALAAGKNTITFSASPPEGTVTVEGSKGRIVRHRSAGDGFKTCSSPVLHFGLGAETGVVTATVKWPGGRVTHHAGLALRKLHRLKAG